MPFFSIIIPTYNRSNFISATVNSILQQTFYDFEIIIIDDGSIDNTEDVISKITDVRIKYFKQQNLERGAARNNGFGKATGEYVIFFDSDDIMYPNNLTDLKNAIGLNPSIRFLTTKFNYFENGKTIAASLAQNLYGGWYKGDIYLKGGMTGIMICIR